MILLLLTMHFLSYFKVGSCTCALYYSVESFVYTSLLCEARLLPPLLLCLLKLLLKDDAQLIEGFSIAT